MPRRRPHLRQAVVLAACALAVAMPGCSSLANPLDAACGDVLPIDDIPASAPRAGGVGPATLHVKVLDASNSSLARVPVLAWWKDDDRVDFVALRTGGDGIASVHAPTGATVRFASGEEAWTHDGFAVAGSPVPARYPGAASDTIELLPATADGFFPGKWTQTVPVGALPVELGPTRVWQPGSLPWADEAHLARLVDLHLRLSWRNNDDGIVDLAIGVGTADDWQQWNQEVQTTQGQHQEDLTLDRALLDAAGWTDGDSLSAGPALGAGGFTPDPEGLTYDLRWTARFTIDPTLGDLCAGLGDVRPRDVTHRSG